MDDDDSCAFGNDNDDDHQSIFNGSNSDTESGKGSLKEAREDLKLMNVVRALVILILLTVSVIAAESVYIVVLRAQEDNFKAAYNHASESLIESFYEKVSNKLWVAQSLATDLSVTSSSAALAQEEEEEQEETWPFVTFYGFEKMCKGPLHQSQASKIALVPIVRQVNRQEWEAYAAREFVVYGEWTYDVPPADSAQYYPSLRTMAQGIYDFTNGTSYTAPSTDDYYMPHWQQSPSFLGNDTATTGLIGGTLFNAFSDVIRHAGIIAMVTRDGAILSTVQFQDVNGTDYVNYTTPRTTMYYPLHSHSGGVKGDIVASISLEFLLADFFQDTLQDYSNQPMVVVLENQCNPGESYQFQVDGAESTFLSKLNASNAQLLKKDYFFVDAYTPISSSYAAFADIFLEHGVQPISPDASGCNYQIHMYATSEFKTVYVNSSPEIYRAIVLLVFISVIMVFVCYDCLVGYRQRRVVTAAERSDAIVSSLFPSKVRDRLYENAKKKELEGKAGRKRNQWTSSVEDIEGKGVLIHTAKNRLKDIAVGAPNSNGGSINEPIADLFKETTILFADLAGFTAWSSEREPTQVFTLLEAIFKDMDRAAKKFSVFKVETVGDCYVAATGIPEYQENHVELMIRFARASLIRTGVLTKQLEQTLGPGTAELAMRIGIHSGSVTAGVLRSQKARFQLFGDTMNYASRMESTGDKNKIHLSSETANRLIKAGRQHWVVKREELTHLKGKGDVQTYWLHLGASSLSQTSTSQTSGDDTQSVIDQPVSQLPPRENKKRPSPRTSWVGTNLEGLLGVTEMNESLERLVKWNVDVMIPLLKNVVAYRVSSGTLATTVFSGEASNSGKILDDVQLFIDLPEFNASTLAKAANEEVELIPEIKSELHEYVKAIASGYKPNAFHNFEHASHVILSANKLLKRIMAADDWTTSQQNNNNMTSKDLHEHTYGIGTDPLTHFAVVFSALIHDVGHEGVPNARLVIEKPEVAKRYSNKCIAEQQSVDIAWQLLLLPRFKNLRACIYQTKDEYQRFKNLIANSVIATDIFDKELKVLRQTRWDRAFGQVDAVTSKEQKQVTDTKATVVIEHVIQASDVSHCMQHWYIYQKWNERLFREMYAAYRAGRAPNNPVQSWYQGELWFFDNYVIPLAKKLKDCGVFGVSSDEYLTYALQNRREWEIKGESVCKAMEERAIEEEEKDRRSMAHKMESVEEEEASSGSGETSSLSIAAARRGLSSS